MPAAEAVLRTLMMNRPCLSGKWPLKWRVCILYSSPIVHDYNCHLTTIRIRADYDASHLPASIQRNSMRAKNERVIFCCSRIAVESNAHCNFHHFRRSRMRRGIVVS